MRVTHHFKKRGQLLLSGALLFAIIFLSNACKTTSRISEDPSQRKSKQTEESSKNQPLDWDKKIDQFYRGQLNDVDADLAFLIAENFINQKQIEPATKLMRSVFNAKPSLISGIELVRLVTINGDLNEAEQISKKLQLYFAKSPEPALARAYIAQLKGNRDEALELLNATQLRFPKNEEVAARHITLLIESGKKAKARQVLLQTIKTMPQSPYFLLRLARLRVEEKNYRDAKNLLDRLLKISPDSIEGWTLAGFIATQENNDAAAERFFREAYEKQPENDTLARYYISQLLKSNKLQEARRLLLRLEATIDGEEQLDNDLIFQLGYVLFQLEEYGEAKKRFLSLVDKANDNDRMYFYAAQCDERLKNHQEAIDFYQKISTTNDLSKTATQRIILLTIEIGKFVEAEALLREYAAIALKKPSDEDFKILASAFAKMAQFNKAQSYAETGLRQFPKSIDLQYLKAAYLEHTMSKAASIAAMEKIIIENPDHAQSLNHLGYTLSEENQKLELAQSLVQRALQKDPKNGFYLDSLGWIYFKQRKFVEAEKSMKSALALEPNEPVIYEHLGELKLALNDFAAALNFFESAIRIFDKQPKWKVDSDIEWSASRLRVERRIQELRRRTIPTGSS